MKGFHQSFKTWQTIDTDISHVTHLLVYLPFLWPINCTCILPSLSFTLVTHLASNLTCTSHVRTKKKKHTMPLEHSANVANNGLHLCGCSIEAVSYDHHFQNEHVNSVFLNNLTSQNLLLFKKKNYLVSDPTLLNSGVHNVYTCKCPYTVKSGSCVSTESDPELCISTDIYNTKRAKRFWESFSQ